MNECTRNGLENREQAAIVKLLAPYLTAFPYCKVNEASLMLYARALQEFSVNEIDAAMLKLLRTSKYFPAVSEIFEAVGSMRAVMSGQDEGGAGVAWHEAMELVRHVGPYRPWTYSSPAVERAVKHFGKMELCELETDAVNTARAQFMRIYNEEAARAKERADVKAALNALPRGEAGTLIKRLAAQKSMDAPKQLTEGSKR